MKSLDILLRSEHLGLNFYNEEEEPDNVVKR
jgi:hypothetical protein